MAKPELRDHRKFLKLMRLLNEPRPHVRGYLDCMWERGYQTGSPVLGDSDDVEAAAEFPGERGKFTTAAFEAGLLDRDADGTFLIHDLYEHAPKYVRMRMQRKGTAPAQACPELDETGTDVPDLGTTVPDLGETRHECETKPRTKNQEPRTKNQEPKAENQEPKASEEVRPPPAPKRFEPPTVAEVADYCRERKNSVDPERFVDFYASKGWRVGDQPMKDWRACVRTWEKRASDRARDGPPVATREGIVERRRTFLDSGS